MKLRPSLKRVIHSCGNTLRALPDGKPWRAVILPLRYRNKLYVEEISVPAGMIDRAAYLYIGLPENDLSAFPRGTVFECCNELLTLTHTEKTHLNDENCYVWAIFSLYSKDPNALTSL